MHLRYAYTLDHPLKSSLPGSEVLLSTLRVTQESKNSNSDRGLQLRVTSTERRQVNVQE
jgi:hypothetical protein